MNKPAPLFPQDSLQEGSEGPAVEILQLILLLKGCNPKIIADGKFGKQTAKGVRKFQRNTGLKQTGSFDTDTRNMFCGNMGLYVKNLTLENWPGKTA